MWLLKKVRWLELQFSFKFLLFLWIFTRYNKVNGNPSAATVTKARCYANCLTKHPASNETEESCQTSICKECLIPCETSFSDDATCRQSCKHSNSCLESCEFLMQLKNFSSIVTGDGSTTPTPGIPIVTNRTFTSISLQWESVKNTTGIPVYLIEMTSLYESRSSAMYLSEVFTKPQATVTFQQLCQYIMTPPFRSEYKPILYKFRVTVLTENSSLSSGRQTIQTTLVKPHPVTNVTLDSLVYDAASRGDKIKLSASWIPPKDQKHLITKFAMKSDWNYSLCTDYYVPRIKETSRPDPTFSLHIYQKLKKCDHHRIRVRSIIGCSASDPATLTFTYPGCKNITNFPKSECYKFDPPEAPIEDRVARNIRPAGPLTAQQDYRFNVIMIWDPPVYPYKGVLMYIAWAWEYNSDSCTGLNYFRAGPSVGTNYSLTNLLPGTTYKFEVLPRFVDFLPASEKRYTNITTPAQATTLINTLK